MTEITEMNTLAVSTLPETDVSEIAASINLQDPTITLTYGAFAMVDIARFADGLLSTIRSKDSGYVGETLTDLMLRVKKVDITGMEKESFVERIPLIGSLFNSTKRTMAQYDTLAVQVETISRKLEDSMTGLIKDVQLLEQFYAHNKGFYENLSLYIEAGKKRLEKARTEELPELQKEAEASNNNITAQNVRDFADAINRFERRLHDLQLSRTITLQTAPQIRLIQSNNQALAEKIQTSILSTIPIWKNQIVLALSIQGQKSAAKMQKDVADTTNTLLKKNAQMLEGAAIDTAREVERSIIDVDSIKEVQTRLISVIEETLRIAQEGRERRVAVEKELTALESSLKEKLTTITVAANKDTLKAAEGNALTP